MSRHVNSLHPHQHPDLSWRGKVFLTCIFSDCLKSLGVRIGFVYTEVINHLLLFLRQWARNGIQSKLFLRIRLLKDKGDWSTLRQSRGRWSIMRWDKVVEFTSIPNSLARHLHAGIEADFGGGRGDGRCLWIFPSCYAVHWFHYQYNKLLMDRGRYSQVSESE